MPKIKYQASLKVQAVTRLIQDNEPISSICEDLKISPVVLEQWRKETIGGLSLVFDNSLRKAERENILQLRWLSCLFLISFQSKFTNSGGNKQWERETKY